MSPFGGGREEPNVPCASATNHGTYVIANSSGSRSSSLGEAGFCSASSSSPGRNLDCISSQIDHKTDDNAPRQRQPVPAEQTLGPSSNRRSRRAAARVARTSRAAAALLALTVREQMGRCSGARFRQSLVLVAVTATSQQVLVCGRYGRYLRHTKNKGGGMVEAEGGGFRAAPDPVEQSTDANAGAGASWASSLYTTFFGTSGETITTPANESEMGKDGPAAAAFQQKIGPEGTMREPETTAATNFIQIHEQADLGVTSGKSGKKTTADASTDIDMGGPEKTLKTTSGDAMEPRQESKGLKAVEMKDAEQEAKSKGQEEVSATATNFVQINRADSAIPTASDGTSDKAIAAGAASTGAKTSSEEIPDKADIKTSQEDSKHLSGVKKDAEKRIKDDEKRSPASALSRAEEPIPGEEVNNSNAAEKNTQVRSPQKTAPTIATSMIAEEDNGVRKAVREYVRSEPENKNKYSKPQTTSKATEMKEAEKSSSDLDLDSNENSAAPPSSSMDRGDASSKSSGNQNTWLSKKRKKAQQHKLAVPTDRDEESATQSRTGTSANMNDGEDDGNGSSKLELQQNRGQGAPKQDGRKGEDLTVVMSQEKTAAAGSKHHGSTSSTSLKQKTAQGGVKVETGTPGFATAIQLERHELAAVETKNAIAQHSLLTPSTSPSLASASSASALEANNDNPLDPTDEEWMLGAWILPLALHTVGEASTGRIGRSLGEREKRKVVVEPKQETIGERRQTATRTAGKTWTAKGSKRGTETGKRRRSPPGKKNKKRKLRSEHQGGGAATGRT
ncbi:unnamed protein product [Amoebophrya sp. A120]|nr:unnamed protein product [Amoebophrya sp. A120]|eukprot:GSA120T00012233001.1